MKNRLLSLLFILISCLTYAQSAKEFEVWFDQESTPEQKMFLSKVFEIDMPAELPFIGVSAYCKDKSVQTKLHYRYRSENQWSDWITFTPFSEGTLTDRKAYEGKPIEHDIQAIQFSSSAQLSKKFIFRLFFPQGLKKNAKLSGGVGASKGVCNCAQPDYCGRDCWCPSGNCPPNPNPATTTPTHLIVHHSAGFNSSSNFRDVVAFYWDLHVNTNGWSDIGYNWLIDANGVIYEGRGDGITGAHFSCMNRNTTGICLIGNFQNLPPSPAALQSLQNLLAWEACDKEIEVLESSSHASSQLTLRNISGHRDGNPSQAPGSCASGTVCPGNLLYAQLDIIADQTANYACLNAAPDIVIGSMWTFPENPLAGDTIDLCVELKNVGPVEAGGLSFDHQINGTPSGGDTLLSLSPGQTFTHCLDNYIFESPASYQYCVYAGAPPGELNTANNSYCLDVAVSGTVAVEMASFVEHFEVYPNPNDGHFNVHLRFANAPKTCLLFLVNSLGQIVYQQKENAGSSQMNIPLDVSLLSSGAYYLKLNTDLGSAVKVISINP